jgi:hypothetical protein
MLPEQIAKFLDDEDFKRLSYKLDDTIADITAGDYFGSRNKTELLHIIAEIVELTYKKGRTDERYYSNGPTFTLYNKVE